MKKYMLSLLLTFAATAAVAQNIGNALHIFRNDGQLNSFLRQDVDSITFSRYDAEGKLFPDVVSQVIHTRDTILYIPLAVIDNVSFVTTDAVCPDDHHPHLIDLGLPSGTKWACCNVGATTPEGYGGYYAWGEMEEKSVYNWDTYKYSYFDERQGQEIAVFIGEDIAKTDYDIAYVKWGKAWYMPTYEQFIELCEKTSPSWTKRHGFSGCIFKGKNGASIFLPAAGEYFLYSIDGEDSLLRYWSSILSHEAPRYPGKDAWCLYYDSRGIHKEYLKGTISRYRGLSIRPVSTN